MKKVLITGNLGYIGIILTEELLKENYDVVGIDTNYYNDELLFDIEFSKEFKQVKKDIRKINLNDLKGIDTVIHLAALSNDPLGMIDPQLTEIINHQTTIQLAQLAKRAQVSQFIFSSSCSVYGQSGATPLTETSKTAPISAYAISKVKSELDLSQIADEDFSPVCLRNATAYGISPSMRFDLVVNNLIGWAYSTKKIKILSDGKGWRPIVHIRDIANAFIAVLKAPTDIIHNEIFNVGINSENYQVKDIAQNIKDVMTNCTIQIVGQDNPDQRSYIVNFDKIQKLKHFKPQWNLQKGIQEIYNRFDSLKLTYDIFQKRNFTRLKQITYLLENHLIDHELYWT
ncbi:MAG: NAD-dependent epimerase/dehydratase family protein [Candidatus Helarchaeota archaeon]